MRSFKTPALAATLAAALAACSSSSSTGTTGGSCLAEAETCTGTANSCCTGLICSPAVGVCLSSQGSGPGVSATTIGGTTHGATTASSNTTSGQFSSTTNGPGSTTSGQFTSGTTSGQQSNTTSGQFSSTTNGPGSTTSGQQSNTTSGQFSSGTTSGQFTSGTTSGQFTGTTSGTTSGHVTTSGSSTSGSSGYAGGCQPATYFATEFGGCADGGTVCGCGQTCVLDTLFEQGVCEAPCTTTHSDCPDILTTCQGGTCKFVQCSPAYASCATGYCLPYDFGAEIDLCQVPGTVGLLGSCPFSSNFANDPSANCASGMECLGAQGATTGFCDTICNPSDNTTCAAATCTADDTTVTDLGYCSDGGF